MKTTVCVVSFLVTVAFSGGAVLNLSNALLRDRVEREAPVPRGGFGGSQAFYSKTSYRSPGYGGIRYPGAYVGGPTLGLGGRPGTGFGYPNKGQSGVSGSSSASNAASQSVSGGGGYPGLGGRPGGFGGGISGSSSNSGSQSFTNGGFSGSSSNSASQSFSSGRGGLSGSSSQASSSSNSFGNGRFGGSGSSSQASSSSNSFSGK